MDAMTMTLGYDANSDPHGYEQKRYIAYFCVAFAALRPARALRWMKARLYGILDVSPP